MVNGERSKGKRSYDLFSNTGGMNPSSAGGAGGGGGG